MYNAIKHIYPNIRDNQFTLQDDGNGPYIKSWSYSESQPSLAQLETAETQLSTKLNSSVEVSMAQARLALLQKGYLQHVNDYFNGMVGVEGEAARIDWEFRVTVRRDHRLVALMQAELLLTDAEVDELFTLAKTL